MTISMTMSMIGVLVGIRGTDFCRADVGTDHRLSHHGRSDNHSSVAAASTWRWDDIQH